MISVAGSPWENGYCESFNSKLRDEFLNGEIFYSMKEIRVLAERWRIHYNTVRPHSSLSCKASGMPRRRLLPCARLRQQVFQQVVGKANLQNATNHLLRACNASGTTGRLCFKTLQQSGGRLPN